MKKNSFFSNPNDSHHKKMKVVKENGQLYVEITLGNKQKRILLPEEYIKAHNKWQHDTKFIAKRFAAALFISIAVSSATTGLLTYILKHYTNTYEMAFEMDTYGEDDITIIGDSHLVYHFDKKDSFMKKMQLPKQSIEDVILHLQKNESIDTDVKEVFLSYCKTYAEENPDVDLTILSENCKQLQNIVYEEMDIQGKGVNAYFDIYANEIHISKEISVSAQLPLLLLQMNRDICIQKEDAYCVTSFADDEYYYIARALRKSLLDNSELSTDFQEAKLANLFSSLIGKEELEHIIREENIESLISRINQIDENLTVSVDWINLWADLELDVLDFFTALETTLSNQAEGKEVDYLYTDILSSFFCEYFIKAKTEPLIDKYMLREDPSFLNATHQNVFSDFLPFIREETANRFLQDYYVTYQEMLAFRDNLYAFGFLGNYPSYSNAFQKDAMSAYQKISGKSEVFMAYMPCNQDEFLYLPLDKTYLAYLKETDGTSSPTLICKIDGEPCDETQIFENDMPLGEHLQNTFGNTFNTIQLDGDLWVIPVTEGQLLDTKESAFERDMIGKKQYTL